MFVPLLYRPGPILLAVYTSSLYRILHNSVCLLCLQWVLCVSTSPSTISSLWIPYISILFLNISVLFCVDFHLKFPRCSHVLSILFSTSFCRTPSLLSTFLFSWEIVQYSLSYITIEITLHLSNFFFFSPVL